MNITEREDFKNGLKLLMDFQNSNDILNNIKPISNNEYIIGDDGIWGNVFTFFELHILEENNFSYKNNNLIYTIH
jgi:hypothetical protein